MVLCDLVHSLGGPVPNYKKLQGDAENWENNLSLGQCFVEIKNAAHAAQAKVFRFRLFLNFGCWQVFEVVRNLASSQS